MLYICEVRILSEKKQEDMQLSKSISDFCKLMDNAKKDYAWYTEKLDTMDKLTQDYLHQLELCALDYKGRAKVATQLAKCRQERRLCKDKIEVLHPVIQFVESDKGSQLLHLLKEVLGKTRKAEDRLNNRTYMPRVLDYFEVKK